MAVMKIHTLPASFRTRIDTGLMGDSEDLSDLEKVYSGEHLGSDRWARLRRWVHQQQMYVNQYEEPCDELHHELQVPRGPPTTIDNCNQTKWEEEQGAL
jgi:hypothetical protein